jgi:protein-disulfide isomerase
MQTTSAVDRAINLVLTVAALAIAATLVLRQVRAETNVGASSVSSPLPTKVGNWADLLAVARSGVNPSAPVKVMVFTDFECAACKRLHFTLSRLHESMRDTFTVRYMHFPLATHANAEPAAAFFECMRTAAVSDSIAGVLYDAQDSLGRIPWTTLAQRVEPQGGANRVTACMGDSTVVAQVRSHVSIGEEIAIAFTPTIVINGWRLDGAPTSTALANYIRAAANGGELDSPNVRASR